MNATARILDNQTADPSAPYRASWERHNPTHGLSDTEARAYWKAHAVQYDCLFALEAGNASDTIKSAWAKLLDAVLAAGKESPAHKQTRDHLRTARRLELDG